MKAFAICWLAAVSLSFAGAQEGVVEIWPKADRLPANFLKFYLQFPEPMERGDVFRHLRLVETDAEGTESAEVVEPFREVELWDETFTRMTLWLHPGRQKEGVNLNVEIGPVLEEGKRYRLEISPEWKTESGDSLERKAAKDFIAIEPDKRQPDPKVWGIGMGIGRAGKASLILHTLDLLDPVSAQRRIEIFSGERKIDFEVDGFRLVLGENPGKGKSIRVVVDPRLEDLAGNSVARPFDLDLEKNPNFEERTEPVVLEFPRKIIPTADAAFP